MDELVTLLNKPIEVMVRGAVESCQDVLFTAPSSEARDELLTIHKELSLATFNITKSDQPSPSKDVPDESSEDAAEEIDPLERHFRDGQRDVRTVRQLMRLIEAYGNPHAVYQALESIYLMGFCSIRDVDMTKEMMNRIPFTDLIKLAEIYIANFILASWLRRPGRS